jgi:hypothetical protein
MARGKALLAPTVAASANVLPTDDASAFRRHTITGFGTPDEAVRISAATAARRSTLSPGAASAECALSADCRCTSEKDAGDSTFAGDISIPARPVCSATEEEPSLAELTPLGSDDGSYTGLAEACDNAICAIGAETAGTINSYAFASPVAASLDLRCRRSASDEGSAATRLTFTGDGVDADAVAIDREAPARELERSAACSSPRSAREVAVASASPERRERPELTELLGASVSLSVGAAAWRQP